MLVVGGGHAGCEAAASSARLGCRTLLLTGNLDTVGLMSCNPAVGGIGKGQLVRELDALGGLMARITDRAGIHFRQLNTSKGMAVRSSRVQVDRQRYRDLMKRKLESIPGLELRQVSVSAVNVSRGRVAGVTTDLGQRIGSRTVVLAPGTFLNGLIHIGTRSYQGGRLGEPAALGLAESLIRLGLRTGRFKTGTPARLDLRSLDLDRMERQPGDASPVPMSGRTRTAPRNRLPCYITHTNPRTHRIIRANLRKSPLYSGKITGTGVRYCPSIEDKVVRFADRKRHLVFVEPEGTNTVECYPNGISTSMPVDVQLRMLRTIAGFGHCRMLRPGYAIEHDYVHPTQLEPTLETRPVRNLFLAGQINGTTGYEEAAVQGLLAGVNAARRAQRKPGITLSRADSYIGVLVDDLVTRGTDEPFRMFTSRVEHRLLLREDNADLRLGPLGNELGLLSSGQQRSLGRKRRDFARAMDWLEHARVRPSSATNRLLGDLGSTALRQALPAIELIRRPEVGWHDISHVASGAPDVPAPVIRLVEVEVKYEGYIERAKRQQDRFRELEKVAVPADIDYSRVPGLSTELKEKLTRARPDTLARANSIPGMTPAALFSLHVFLRAKRR